jgi:uncharacterized protein DUF5772
MDATTMTYQINPMPFGFDNKEWVATKHASIKILTSMLFLFSFLYLPIYSVWFTFSISLAIGSGYYLLRETQPQFMMILSLIIKYQINKLKYKFKTWTNSFMARGVNNSKIRLQSEYKFNFLEYYDVDNDKKYIYLFDQKLRSNDLIIFRNESDEDITASLEPYLGPMQNFHGTPLTPADFNLKKLKIFRDGNICMSKIFEENEPLNFEP